MNIERFIVDKVLGFLMLLASLIPTYVSTVLYYGCHPNTMGITTTGYWHWFPVAVAWSVVLLGWVMTPTLFGLVVWELISGN
jgi:hypothetical protein